MTPEQIKTLEENLAIAIEALKYYANLEEESYRISSMEFDQWGSHARDALVKIAANNVATRYHNTLKNLKD
jgi:hypothetical protein